ncbi:hypothetical protein O6H91_10G100600 [Diphasiastrum complanatum]|uniref:Uncharacterized protein n=1 Tax=Diphasiastrum complanatum TaxID=34168 RepID=A0ACC2CJX1_DIPCM|nr:hypothetical protein O6H91_10G100600 [Diphasiastrum complanatum]
MSWNSLEAILLIKHQRSVAHSAMNNKFLLFAIFSMLLLNAYAWDSAEVQANCAVEDIPPGSSYFQNLQHVFADIERKTCLTKDYMYKTQHSEGGTIAYGLGSCTISLAARVCSSCLKFLVNNLWRFCGSPLIGILNMPNDCSVQFQDTDF